MTETIYPTSFPAIVLFGTFAWVSGAKARRPTQDWARIDHDRVAFNLRLGASIFLIPGIAGVDRVAVYYATKFAVPAIFGGLRQGDGGDIRAMVVSPGVAELERAERISADEARQGMKASRKVAIPAKAVAGPIARPDDVDVREIVIRPTASSY